MDDTTAEEAKKLLTLHGHEQIAQDIIDACASVVHVIRLIFALMLFVQLCCFAKALPLMSGGSRVGDLTASCNAMVAGKALPALKQEALLRWGCRISSTGRSRL